MTRRSVVIAATSVIITVTLPLPGVATAAAQTARAGSAGSLPSTDDKTGTNPLNIQTTVAVANEFQSLPDTLFRNESRYLYVTPLHARTMSAALEVPIVASNVTGRTEASIGDLGARWNWIPWLGRSKGLVLGVDTTWNTSTNAALGTGRHTLAPFAQFVSGPSDKLVTAVTYRQRQSFGGDADRVDVAEGTASLYLAWLPAPAMWMIAEPRLILDYERNNTSGRVDVEWGRLLIAGLGTYIRPGFGIGSVRARPFDWKLEVGFRVIP